MVVKVCPHCNTRYVTQLHSGDFVHDCSVSTSVALRNDDIVRTTSYDDYSGSGTFGKAVVLAGAENKLQGTRGGIDGGDLDNLTARGNRASTTRERTHLEYIGDAGDIEDDCN